MGHEIYNVCVVEVRKRRKKKVRVNRERPWWSEDDWEPP
jgi:hypothetical protein